MIGADLGHHLASPDQLGMLVAMHPDHLGSQLIQAGLRVFEVAVVGPLQMIHQLSWRQALSRLRFPPYR